MPKLILLKSMRAVKEFELTGALSIGRDESNPIRLEEERASRVHCRVTRDGGRVLIEDLESANGIYLNGSKVKSAELKHNDRITVGGSTLLFDDGTHPELPNRRGDTIVLQDAAALPPAEMPAPSKDSQRLVARAPERRRKKSKHSASTVLTLAGSALLLCGAIYFLWNVLHERPAEEFAERRDARPRATSATPPISAAPYLTGERATDVRPRDAHANVSGAQLNERFQTAVALRDRALTTGNLLTAKVVLRRFLESLSDAEVTTTQAAAARREAAETERVVGAALQLQLAQARDALAARRFQLFVQRCTAVLSNDPHGEFGREARALLEVLDERTAPVAAAAKSNAQMELAQGRIEQARSTIEAALGQLSGTRWGGDFSALHLRVIMAAGLLAEMETARAKKAAAGSTVRINVASKKIEGVLLKLDGLHAQLESSGATLMVALNNIDSAEFTRLLERLEMPPRHAELACLWTLLERPADALAESEAALKAPGGVPMAASLAGMLAHSSNLHLYDFSGWRQQADWEALSGSWMTQDEKYVLVSADGGETALKEERIGGPFPLEHACVSFELEILQPSPGWFFVCEFGGARQSLALQFSADELTLTDKSGARTQSNFKLSGSPLNGRVELLIDADHVKVLIDSKPAAELTCPGISRASGTLNFQARQCACSLDNVILRTAEKR